MPPVDHTVAAEAQQAQVDLLIMHKIGLASALGADLEVRRRAAQQTRASRRVVGMTRTRGTEVTDVIAWLPRDIFLLA
jgi:Ni2+-binding GTPase involved in maturation of urease and hydrogenase